MKSAFPLTLAAIVRTILITGRRASDPFMKMLKLIWQTTTEIVRHIWLLPQTIAQFGRRRQQRVIQDKLEVERLDRIRNPWKYRGK